MLGSTWSAGVLPAARSGRNLAELLEPIAAELPRVEEALICQVQGFDQRLADYVQYVLGGTGKRLRPSLALLAGGATGRVTEEHITLAVIVELIHVATLVHDDVLDDAQIRHRLPTLNSRWGNEISILLGDCLFAHALRLASGYSTTEVCRKISEATNTVCSGEILQTQRRFNLDLTLDQYLNIIHMKTGALFAVSCELGATLNEAPLGTVKSIREFGANLGIAYQIYDDCVDIFGQERQAGKSLGTDMKKGKLTLPFLLLLQHVDSSKREELGAMIFRNNQQEQQHLLRLVLGNGVVGESFAAINTYISRAQTSLAALSATPYSTSLSGLTSYFAEQSRRLLKQPAVD
ncbi:MAG TPA: polyprenyl synthetase family protein [Verrucomicrobiae bacterium]|nr:polyprenyl synthetase family protein [Verrucomicrobiae bacterium]